ncbi:DNA alkylation repair protein [Verminephrobacter aporrectodeae]|uniref:DNA alkylation repair protein n=1 Tax=Verminephrobacter aporrectodeae TaxID=1110389 RepID=UPI002242F5DF|nr:DNA alkylation repair protein [Verminephrobacter aporrectodeae]
MEKMDASRLAALNRGEVEARNLAECLAINQSVLLKTVLSEIGMSKTADSVFAMADLSGTEGISHKMAKIGMALREALGNERYKEQIMQKMVLHPSDTVRSWAAFVVARAADGMALEERLAAVRAFAADTHFGVREWAWMATRPYLAADIAQAIRCLTPWTADGDANIRRFSVESIRPRGVWCEHIKELKECPWQAEALLDRLHADSSRYVQDSVSNWINDASKSQPKWAQQLCERWSKNADGYSKRIISRALRTLSKKETSRQTTR